MICQFVTKTLCHDFVLSRITYKYIIQDVVIAFIICKGHLHFLFLPPLNRGWRFVGDVVDDVVDVGTFAGNAGGRGGKEVRGKMTGTSLDEDVRGIAGYWGRISTL